MRFSKTLLLSTLLMMGGAVTSQARQWSLQQCLDYALQNNIQLKQQAITRESSREDVAQSRSALFPSVSFSTSQNMNYRPFAQQTIALENGTMTTSSDAVSYNGSYGVNARWTVWNGGRNRMNIEQNELTVQQNELAEQQQANSIQEQIAKLFVQILYENEAIKVNEATLAASRMQVERAKTMVEVGSLARVDQVQLESQVAQDEYSLVSAQNRLQNYILQLKQLLEIHDEEAFDITIPTVNDAQVLSLLPSTASVYERALEVRPEVDAQKLKIESSKLSVKSARAGYMPTISVSSSLGTNNSSAQQNGFGSQIKKNLSFSMGATLSMNIFDNLETRTNIRKAKLSQLNAELQLQDVEKTLYSSIENYHLDATSSQQQYLYAKKNVESMQQSYDLVSEQFRLGLKNIVELTTGKNNLLQAQQQLLETKYTALFNQAMLRFYQGEAIQL